MPSKKCLSESKHSSLSILLTDLTGHKNETSRDIKDKVCDGLEYLYSRADFWRQQKPMYARKRDKERQMRAMRRGDLKAKGSMARILRNLEEIDEGRLLRKCTKSKTLLYIRHLFELKSILNFSLAEPKAQDELL